MTERGTDLIVVGAGLAGLTAAAHAVKAGARVRLIAQGWGQQMVTPGWISVWDDALDDIFTAIEQHIVAHPEHPYARVGIDTVRDSLVAFDLLATQIDLPHACGARDHSLRLPTLLGAGQTPLCAPEGLARGDLSTMSGHSDPVLLVGLRGWRDFRVELMAGHLEQQGVPVRAVTIDVPAGTGTWDAWPGDLARRFDDAAFRREVIAQIKPHCANTTKIGLPAVLGLEHHQDALDDLHMALGRPVFEIATLPPSVPGLRLSTRLRRWLLRQRARVQIGHPVVRGLVEQGRCVGVEVAALGHTNTFFADHVILATGGIYNGGLQTDVTGRVWEPLFDLPVQTPPGAKRTNWTYEHLLVEHGHPIHRHTGLRVDDQLRPVNAESAPVLENLYAVGHLLAGFNPLTDGCAEGVALATAYHAVRSALGVSVSG